MDREAHPEHSSYESRTITPDQSHWPRTRHELSDSSLQKLRIRARQRIVTEARRYRELVCDAGRRVNFLRQIPAALDGDPETTMIVMTGHQPVIFHSGITFKYEVTQDFSSQQGAIGIAVMIDSDSGDAGAFSCPGRDGRAIADGPRSALSDEYFAQSKSLSPAGEHRRMDGASAQSGSANAESDTRTSPGELSSGSLLLGSTRLADPAALQRISAEVSACLRNCGEETAAEHFKRNMKVYCALARSESEQGESAHIFRGPRSGLNGRTMQEANLIARWNAGIGDRLMEIPFTAICRFPEVQQILSGILAQPRRFAEVYNHALAEFRMNHRIRNRVNPFPDLHVDESRCEAPFWMVNTELGTRTPVFIHDRGSVCTLKCGEMTDVEVATGHEAEVFFTLLVSGRLLVPRGAVITTVLRLLFSDLFVHGTGGGKYDAFTDELALRWWNVRLSPYTVASASRYLFDQTRSEFQQLQHLTTIQRDLQFNPGRYLDGKHFSATTEGHLREKIELKDKEVMQLQAAREAGQSGAEIHKRIRQLAWEIQSIVREDYEPRIAVLRSVRENSPAVWLNRAWPWLYFQSCVDEDFDVVCD